MGGGKKKSTILMKFQSIDSVFVPSQYDALLWFLILLKSPQSYVRVWRRCCKICKRIFTQSLGRLWMKLDVMNLSQMPLKFTYLFAVRNPPYERLTAPSSSCIKLAILWEAASSDHARISELAHKDIIILSWFAILIVVQLFFNGVYSSSLKLLFFYS